MRPGLAQGKRAQRLLQSEKKREAHRPLSQQAIREAEEEARDRGLRTAITSSNKGFQLLLKSSGKQNAPAFSSSSLSSTSGSPAEEADKKLRTPPAPLIPLVILKNRQGLKEGMLKTPASTAQPVKKQKTGNEGEDRLSEDRLQLFRSKQQSSMSVRMLAADVRASQKAIHHMDTDAGLREPEEEYLWPEAVVQALRRQESDEPLDSGASLDPKEEDRGPESEDSLSAKLTLLTSHLRSKYLYCLWCGSRFESKESLATDCPGASRQAHD